MIEFTQGNLLEAEVEALVNTVNTVGVMGKGIALMFKERFPENFKAYAAACAKKEVRVGRMFVTAGVELSGPRWIINFPTKEHWRGGTQPEWIESGLDDLRRVIQEKQIHSMAIPPLGCGNGGLDWRMVRPMIEAKLGDLPGVAVTVFEPTSRYQNVAKKRGVETLTPARALIVEMVRRYSVIGFECSILEIQKLAWFLERVITRQQIEDPLKLEFAANRYGPYAHQLTHLLNSLDGSYMHCDKRLADASPSDVIRFDERKAPLLDTYLASSEAAPFRPALDETDRLIDQFQSPLGMEALATVDWLLFREHVDATLPAIREALNQWAGGNGAAERKQRVFSDRLIEVALGRLTSQLSE